MLARIGMGTPQGSNRVIRGGSWNNSAVNLRSANRNNNNANNRNNNIGLRLLSAQCLAGWQTMNRALVQPLIEGKSEFKAV